jgi:hypothetical protein
MKAPTLFGLCGLSLSSLSLAGAGAHSLNGDYPFNETIRIAQQPATDGACPTSAAKLAGPVAASWIVDTGVWSFDGKGNMRIRDSGLKWLADPISNASQIVPVETNCVGTYEVLNETTVDFRYKCTEDEFASYFLVHTIGKMTPYNILVEGAKNGDGSIEVMPFVRGGSVVGCAVIGEDTVVARKPRSRLPASPKG